MFTWGENDQGQMGIGSGTGIDLIESESSPHLMEFENPTKIVEMRCGESTMIMKDESGKIFRTGLKLNYTPAEMKLPKEFKFGKIQKIFCGRKHYTLLDGIISGSIIGGVDSNNLLWWGSFISKGHEEGMTKLRMLNGTEIFNGKILDMSTKYSVYAAVIEPIASEPKKQ